VVTVEGGPHNIAWTHPDIVNPALLDFLAKWRVQRCSSRRSFVKSSGCSLISEQAGRPLAEPPHGWSRSTDQNASRPRWFWVAKLTRVLRVGLAKHLGRAVVLADHRDHADIG
jgi:hypothetical protein